MKLQLSDASSLRAQVALRLNERDRYEEGSTSICGLRYGTNRLPVSWPNHLSTSRIPYGDKSRSPSEDQGERFLNFTSI